jgi:hypothetical protein
VNKLRPQGEDFFLEEHQAPWTTNSAFKAEASWILSTPESNFIYPAIESHGPITPLD